MRPLRGFIAVRPAGPAALRIHTRHGWTIVDLQDAFTLIDQVADAAEAMNQIWETP